MADEIPEDPLSSIWQFDIVENGEVVEHIEIELFAVDGVEWRDMRMVTGFDREVMLLKMGALDIEACGAIAWIALRRADPELSYDAVLRRLDTRVLSANTAPAPTD